MAVDLDKLQIQRGKVLTANNYFIAKLHPKVREKFSKFMTEAMGFNLDLQIYSGLRNTATQAKLYADFKSGKSKIEATPPGSSSHELGFAIDTYVLDVKTGKWDKFLNLYKLLEPIANKYGLRWLGSVPRLTATEMHHFDIFYTENAKKFTDLKKQGIVDANGYILIDDINTSSVKPKVVQISKAIEFSSEIGANNSIETSTEKEIKSKSQPNLVTKIEEHNAVGIWQIIKLIADQYSLSQNINDATIAFDQGSLLNFVKKVVQEPWLQFFGDTINDQYYFQVRKEPFDLSGWRDSMTTKVIILDDVISDNLDWYNGPIYSWFQIIPKGSFLGEQNLIFQHIAAVFFEEYAEVWGSKPMSIVSNYLNFVKISDGKIMLEKAIEDLKYLVESHMYLPFTRTGTIVIKGDYSWKRGQKVTYLPSGEQFYIDSVAHSYQVGDTGPNFLTTLRVSRGMVTRYLTTPQTDDEISYWNLILFKNPDPKELEYEEQINEQRTTVYFDNNKGYLIDLSESFEGKSDTASKKMSNQIKAFPGLRKQLHDYSLKSVEKAVDIIKNFPDAPLICYGYVDVDKGGKTPILAKKRAETLRSEIIKKYIEKYSDKTKDELIRKIKVEGRVNYVIATTAVSDGGKLTTNDILGTDVNELKKKSLERTAQFIVEKHKTKKKKTVPQEGIAWRVNDPVFQFFLKRKQQNDCNLDFKKSNDAIDKLLNKPI